MSERLYSYGKNHTNFWALAERLKKQTDWYMGNMWAEKALGPRDYGRLPQKWHKSVSEATYIVYSWSTPIAWVDKYGKWVQPDVKYSNTTTKQQGKIAVALSVIEKV